jgi:3-oxoadipate enol-lactonase
MPDVRVNGIKIHYEERGEGEPVLFLHGMGASWRLWKPQVEDFAPHWRMIMVDLRGHGESGPFLESGFSFQSLADDLPGLLDQLGVERCRVVGLSMGAVTALSFTSRYPQYVERLVISNGYSEMPTTGAEWLVKVSNVMWHLMPWSLIYKLVCDWGWKGTPGYELTREMMYDSISIDKKRMIQMKTAPMPNITGDLKGITAPTLVLGGRTKKVPFEERGSRLIYENTPDAVLALFDGAFDPLNTMRKDIWNDMVLDFLAGRALKAYPGVEYVKREKAHS